MVFRLSKRVFSYLRQIATDLSWHKRMTGLVPRGIVYRILEQSYLLINSAVCAEDYYQLGLASREDPLSVKRSFLGSYEKWRYFNVINPPVYDIIARDKALFHHFAQAADLPLPVTKATIAPGPKPSCGVVIETESDLTHYMYSGPAENLFFKPVDGSLGEGALSIGAYCRETDSWEMLPERSKLSIDQLVERLSHKGKLVRTLVQERLKPHPVLAEILPDVCSTIRYMTLCTSSGVEHLGAALRIGSGRGPTDNLAGGGMLAPIDLVTGIAERAILLDMDMPQSIDYHPVTQASFADMVIPDWDEVKALVERGAKAFSFLPCIGWDIGITDQGPVVVEINTRPRCISVQTGRASGLLHSALGLELAKKTGFLESGVRLSKIQN